MRSERFTNQQGNVDNEQRKTGYFILHIYMFYLFCYFFLILGFL